MLGKITLATLALLASVQAQVVIGGGALAGGPSIISNVGAPPPPPLPTIQARMFGGIYNSSSPTWPPRDAANVAMQQGTCRIWDSGAKVGQIMTVSGPPGAHTYSFNWTPFDNLIKRCQQLPGSTFTGAPNAPMKVIYTLGDTPCGAALAAIGSQTNPPCGEQSLPTSGTCPVGQVCCPAGQTCSCLQPDVNYSCAAYDDNVTGSASENDTTMLTFLANLFSHAVTLGAVIDAVELQNEWDTAGFQCWAQASGCGSPATNPHTTVNATMNKALVQRGWDLKATRDCKSPATQIYSPSWHQLTIQPGEIFDNFINTSTTVHALTGGVNGYPAGCPNLPSQTVFGWQVISVVNGHPDGNPSKAPLFNTPESFVATDQLLVCELTVNCKSQSGNSHSGNAFLNVIGMPKTADEFGAKTGDCTTGACLEAAAARRYIYCAWLVYQDCDWYQMDSKAAFEALVGTLGGNGFDKVALWLIGNTTLPFTSPVGTVYTEALVNSGVSELVVYDSGATEANNGYTCPNTVGGLGCTTVVVPAGYSTYQSIDGVQHSVNASHQIAVGGNPVCVSTGPC